MFACCLARSGGTDGEQVQQRYEIEEIEEPNGPRWQSASSRKSEILRATLPVPTAKAFYELFIGDDASYTLLDAEVVNSITEGSLSKWTPGQRRKMCFKVPTKAPPWLGPPQASIEQVHGYRFVSPDDDCLGARVGSCQEECFEFVREVFSRGVPFADAWWGQQVWTVQPVCVDGELCCRVTISADVFFTGAVPLLAPVITKAFVSESRAVVQHWLEKARGALDARQAHAHGAPMNGTKASHPEVDQLNKQPNSVLTFDVCIWAAIVLLRAVLVFLILHFLAGWTEIDKQPPELQVLVRKHTLQIGLLSAAHRLLQAIKCSSTTSSVIYTATAYCFVARLFCAVVQDQAKWG